MSNYDYLDEQTPYRKKSTARPPKKSKHKHLVEPCILEYPLMWHMKGQEKSRGNEAVFSGYCPICGKIGTLKDKSRWYSKNAVFIGNYLMNETVLTEEGKKEMDPETRTLPTFYVDDPFAKFVELKEKKEEE